MFMTGAKPFTSGTSGLMATMWFISGFWMLMAIMVIVTPTITETQAVVQ